MAITKITTSELFNLQSNNTEGTQLPVMTTTQREAMTGMSNGELIFNSTTDSVEYYDLGAAEWYKIDYPPGWSADLFGDGSNMFTSDFSNSTADVIEGNGASIYVSPTYGGTMGFSSNVPNSGFVKSLTGTANQANQIFDYSMQSGDSLTSVKTYSFWVYVTKIDDDDNTVMAVNMKRQNNTTMWVYSYTGSTAGPIDKFPTVSINTWHNMVVVDEGTIMRTYLDNVSIGTISIGSNVLLRTVYQRIYGLADADSRSTQFITGVRMFNRAVTASEVDTIYNEVPVYT